MSREKQIDIEKLCAITDIKNLLCSMPCDICSMYGKGCINEHIANRLANAGYRKQREGKWIARKDKGLFGKEYYECSICHSRNPTIKYNYCKNCGAKMKGGAE